MAAALATLLALASVASAASEPLTGGTTSLALKKGFANKLDNNDIKVLKQGSGKVSGGTIQLGVSSGDVDVAAVQGSIAHSGGFKLKRGKHSISVTKVGIDLSGSVSAKVGGKSMTLGSLSGVSAAQTGTDVDIKASSLKLSGKAAKAIDKKLGLDGALKGGNAMSDVVSKAQVAPATPVPAPLNNDIAPPPAPQNKVVGVMTRNLYLGANLLPAIGAGSQEALFNAAGVILDEVEHNDFPTRAIGLADEILTEKPDLVGLQEVALWRTGPVNGEVLTKGPSASTVKYDYLQELLAELNADGTQYEVVVVQPEFDFESPANTEGSAAPDLNGRLTMRDVILKRAGAGVETWNAEGDNFATLLTVPVLMNPLPVRRGWTATDASVRGSRPFHFVNTHLEAFHPIVRAQQATELIDPPDGAAISDLPVILLGDLNSDDDTTPAAGDSWAYDILHHAGLEERSTNKPLSCCIDASEIGESDGGSKADFNHQVDHIMTDDHEGVLLLGTAVTGLDPVNGFWNSDHAGLFSSLEVLP